MFIQGLHSENRSTRAPRSSYLELVAPVEVDFLCNARETLHSSELVLASAQSCW
jgi:hypothetical protein